MLLLILGLLTQPEPAEYEPPDEYAIFYGMDMSWAQFSRSWEDNFDTSRSAFMSSQGSHDMRHWFQVHRLRMEVDFAEFFSLRYRIDAHYDFEVAEHRHRIEPIINIGPHLRFHLMISPFWLKRFDQMGAGITLRSGNSNWISLYSVIEGFNHNNSMRHISPGPDRDPYDPAPYRFELDARGELPWLKARLHGELGTRSRQYLDWPDSTWYFWERDHDRSSAWGRIEVQPFNNLWAGSRFLWLRSRDQTVWPEQDSAVADTVHDRWIAPFVSFSPTERLELYAEYRFWRLYRGFDSLSYRRNLDVVTFQINWQVFPFMQLQAGYQQSLQYRYVNDSLIAEPWTGRHDHARLMLNAEFTSPSGLKIVVKEGLKMYDFPYALLRRFHAHTYVQFYIPLGSLFPQAEKESPEEKVKGIDDR